jgi:hypothetical protein
MQVAVVGALPLCGYRTKKGARLSPCTHETLPKVIIILPLYGLEMIGACAQGRV